MKEKFIERRAVLNKTGKMVCKWNTEQDISDRLHGSLVLYKEKPYWVSVQGIDLFLRGTVSGKIMEQCSYDDPDLDVSSPPLGFFNLDEKDFANQSKLNVEEYKSYTLYAYRTPIRRYKQGLTYENLAFQTSEGATIGAFFSPGKGWMSTVGFRQMLLQDYPDLDKACEIIRDTGRSSIALSNSVVLKKAQAGVFIIKIQDLEIGWSPPGLDTIHVPGRKFTWVITQILEPLFPNSKILIQ